MWHRVRRFLIAATCADCKSLHFSRSLHSLAHSERANWRRNDKAVVDRSPDRWIECSSEMAVRATSAIVYNEMRAPLLLKCDFHFLFIQRRHTVALTPFSCTLSSLPWMCVCVCMCLLLMVSLGFRPHFFCCILHWLQALLSSVGDSATTLYFIVVVLLFVVSHFTSVSLK